MADTMEKLNVLRGGAFVIQDSTPDDTFIPEELNEEQRMVQDMVRNFLKSEIDPVRNDLEKQKERSRTHVD